MRVSIWVGDAYQILRSLPPECFNCCVTSPPYFGLRDYGCAPSAWPAVEYAPMAGMSVVSIPAMECCLGLEPTPEAFVAHIVLIFREVRRGLAADGTLWLNFGDSYYNYRTGYNGALNKQTFHKGDNGKPTDPDKGISRRSNKFNGIKEKDLFGIPWRVAFALQADGWYLRQDIIWNKPNPMPESVTDRCTKAHEYIFLFSKSERYYYDHVAVKEEAVQTGRVRADKMGGNKGGVVNHSPGATFTGSDTRNKRSVWTITPKPFKGAHFATFPPDLVEPCILAGCPAGGTTLDPFGGSGTTGMVAGTHGRNAILLEINPTYAEMARQRTGGEII